MPTLKSCSGGPARTTRIAPTTLRASNRQIVEALATERSRAIAPDSGCTRVSQPIILVHHVLGADHRGRVAAMDVPEVTLALKGDDDLGVAHAPAISSRSPAWHQPDDLAERRAPVVAQVRARSCCTARSASRMEFRWSLAPARSVFAKVMRP